MLHLLLRWLLRNSYCEVEAALFPHLFRSFLTTSFAPWVVIHTNIRTCTFTSIHVYVLYTYQMENPFSITSLSPVDYLCVSIVRLDTKVVYEYLYHTYIVYQCENDTNVVHKYVYYT